MNITAEGDDLTNDPKHDKLGESNKHTFIFRASWASTAKFIKIEARTEDEAFDKAYHRRDIVGCIDLVLIRERY